MKIALCFSGLPRFIDKTVDNIKHNIIQDYDVDVFAHTWYKKDLIMRDDGSDTWSSLIYNQNPTEIITTAYNVKSICVEEPIDFYTNSLLHQYNIKPTLEKYMPHFLSEKGMEYFINLVHSMWYSIYRSNQLKVEYELAHNFTYDLVVRSRFDTLYNKPIPFNSYDLTAINVSHNAGTIVHPQVRDWFAFSTSHNMDIYADVYNNLKTLNDQIEETERANEVLLYHQLKNNNLQVNANNFISDFVRS